MRPTFHHALWAVLSATAIVAGAMMPSSTLAATFVYVGNTESNEIYVLQLDRQNGELTVVERFRSPASPNLEFRRRWR